MQKDPTHLVWMDLEMSGLHPESDVVLELATVITDKQLEITEIGPNLVIAHPEEILKGMDDWNVNQHTKSGLWNRVLESRVALDEAESETFEFIKKYTVEGQNILCGNSIHQDRRFIKKYLYRIDSHLHYRMIDVSTVKELSKRWYTTPPAFQKKGSHRALGDVLESIAELKFYKDTIFLKNHTSK